MAVNTGVLRGGPRRGQYSKSVAGAADVTLGFDEIYESIVLTGALTGNISVILPLGADEAGFGFNVENQTTGNFTVSLKKAGGTGMDLPAGQRTEVLWSGTVFTVADTSVQVARVQLTAAQILDLADTPVELVAAPGAGKYLEFLGAVLLLDHAGTGFAENADNLEVHYENEAGAAASAVIEMTGFIDQTADSLIEARPLATALVRAKTAVENKALVLTNINDDFTDAGTTTSVLRVATRYRVLATGW
jgi:hypothetical protein